MSKYILTALMLGIAGVSQAATSISTTLTLTSPSAVISMTGVSATAYLTNVYSNTVSASLVSASTVSATIVSSTSPNIAFATANFNGFGGCAIRKGYNISGCTRVSQGVYGISFTTPAVSADYSVGGNCMRNNTNETWFELTDQTSSPTVTGFTVRCQASAGANDTARGNIIVFP